MRIASLSPAATEVLCALGKGNMIVCADRFSDFPEEAQAIPKLNEHQAIDSRDLSGFHPDLVITETPVQERLAAQLRAADFSVVHIDPRTLNEVLDSFRSIAVLVDAERQAKELIQKFQSELHEVQKKGKLLPNHPTIYIEEWPHPPMVSGNWVPELVRAAGGRALPLEPRAISREVTLTEIQKFDPDIIVLSWCGAGSKANKEDLLRREGWGELRAVQKANIRVIDDSLLNRPGPRLVEGAKRLLSWCAELAYGS